MPLIMILTTLVVLALPFKVSAAVRTYDVERVIVSFGETDTADKSLCSLPIVAAVGFKDSVTVTAALCVLQIVICFTIVVVADGHVYNNVFAVSTSLAGPTNLFCVIAI